MSRNTSSLSVARQAGAAVRILLVMTLLLGVAYPAVVWAAGQIAFHDQAAGSLVREDGRTIGSSLLGQQWTGDQWFHGRPSASDYAGDTSGGSNLTATDARLLKGVEKRRAGVPGDQAPPDALTASGSGLDPHISPAYAERQVARVAGARGLSPTTVRTLIRAHTQERTLGFIGEPRVNVLELNRAVAAQTAPS